MNEREPTHVVSARIQNWTKEEYLTPGLVAPSNESHEHFRGTVADCDLIAAARGITILIDDFPATDETPVHYRFYMEPTPNDPGISELWCWARPIERITPWIANLPTVADVFSTKSAPHEPAPQEPAADKHLEDLYDSRQSGWEDLE